MGRTSTAKERLIETALTLIHDKGFGAAGVNEICAKARVNKGSFYYFFESKLSLGLATIDAYAESAIAKWREISNAHGPALGRLERIFGLAYQYGGEQKRTAKKVCGCMLGNLALEQSTQDPQIQSRVKATFDGNLQIIEDLIREAVEEGALPEGTDASGKAVAALSLMQGSVMLAKVQNDPKLLRDVPKQVIGLIRM